MIKCELNRAETQTAYGPLCILGHYLTQKKVLQPLEQIHIPQKTIKHSPTQKLLDALVGILAGCSALYQLNVKVRPDRPLQQAFGRERCADQSAVSATLNAFTKETVTQLRQAVETIHRRQGRIFTHDYEQEFLILEVDLTGLVASKNAEGSTKGYFPRKRNRRGRQLVQVTTPQYGEVLFEKLYPGNTSSREVLKETLTEVERILGLDEAKRKRTLIRLDGGFGTDENLNWLGWRGYQFIAKGYSGTRAQKVAESVPEDDWREGPTRGQELGRPTRPHRYGRRTKTVARRWRDKKGKLHCDLLITTLVELSRKELAKGYDCRGGMEVEIKGDKRGLGLEKRRKKRFYAQEALVLLAQLAHNLLVWFKRWFLRGTKAAQLGMERLVQEVLAMPAQVKVGRGGSKVRLKFPTLHPWAKAVWKGVRVRFPRSGWRAICGQN
jgi:hypothetical protein